MPVTQALWSELRLREVAELRQMLSHSSSVPTQRYVCISESMVRQGVENLEMVVG